MKDNYNIIGIGLGPSNLALATALGDRSEDLNISYQFLEHNKNPEWHPGMLIPGMQLQVPFFRDLATLRNPRSKFTFLNYLKSNNRLDEFINLRTFYPSRVEFQDYLQWVRGQISHISKPGYKVHSISPLTIQGRSSAINKLEINCTNEETGQLYSCTTENVVISIGKEPYIPSCINNPNDNKIIHTSSLLTKTLTSFPDIQAEYHFIVVGSGQSAGEAAHYLLNKYQNSSVSLCFRSYTLHSADNSPFVNLKYHQKAVDEFYELSELAKTRALEDLKTSNYSVVDIDLLRKLYNIQYEGILQQKQRISICSSLSLENLNCSTDLVCAQFTSQFSESKIELKGNGIILATGYNQNNYRTLLQELECYLKKDYNGDYEITKDYRIEKVDNLLPNIYLQGYCEHSHGPSDSTLAIMSTRSELILNSIVNSYKTSPCVKDQELWRETP